MRKSAAQSSAAQQRRTDIARTDIAGTDIAKAAHVELAHGGWVRHLDHWLSFDVASALAATLRRELEWEQRAIQLFGKQVLQPRLIAWAGTLPYRYSGQTLEPRPWPASLHSLAQDLERVSGVRFNHVLINRYRNGDDCMGWHSDDEPELGIDPPVASVSLGIARRFLMQPKKRSEREAVREWLLGHGHLLVMGGSTQHHYRHCVPRQRAATGERISLTFRRVLRAPAPLHHPAEQR